MQKSYQPNARQSDRKPKHPKNALPTTRVPVAQLPFLEILFQKHEILTSLEAILERFFLVVVQNSRI